MPLLEWAALERLVTAGITFGAHTRTHPRLTHLDAAAIEDEIIGSVECLRRRLGVVPQAFAYPYGEVSPAATHKVSETFSWGCTTEHRPFGMAERPALLPRLDMYYYRAAGRLEAWQTRSFTAPSDVHATTATRAFSAESRLERTDMTAPRIFTAEYYDRMRRLEASSWWNAGMREVAATLLKQASLPPTGIMLDVGCGSGQTISWFAGNHPGWRTVGIDVASEAVAAAHRARTTGLCRVGADVAVRGSLD